MKSTKKEMEHFNAGYNKGFVEGYEQGNAEAIDEFETRILGNCSLMLKDGERVIVIRQDIFRFILEQMQKRGVENG